MNRKFIVKVMDTKTPDGREVLSVGLKWQRFKKLGGGALMMSMFGIWGYATWETFWLAILYLELSRLASLVGIRSLRLSFASYDWSHFNFSGVKDIKPL